MNEYKRLLDIVTTSEFKFAVAYIKRDENFLCALELPDEEIDIYLIYQGTSTPIYFCFWNNELLFHGVDYKPAPTHDWDSLECILHLLSFLLLKPGYADPDFFKDHTDKQKEYINSESAAKLSLPINDFIFDEGLLKTQATEYFNQFFK